MAIPIVGNRAEVVLAAGGGGEAAIAVFALHPLLGLADGALRKTVLALELAVVVLLITVAHIAGLAPVGGVHEGGDAGDQVGVLMRHKHVHHLGRCRSTEDDVQGRLNVPDLDLELGTDGRLNGYIYAKPVRSVFVGRVIYEQNLRYIHAYG